MTAVKPASELLYVYGIVRQQGAARPTIANMPAGVEDTAVELLATSAAAKGDRIAALVSRVPAGKYEPAIVEQNSGEVSWLSPRAMAHDRVLTWAHDHGGVIPMPMFSLWRSPDALERSITEQRDDLAALFNRLEGADEFGLRVHRRDVDMLASIDELDPDVAALRAQARDAQPGQRYLLERKIAEQGKRAVKAASQRMAKELFDELAALSRDALARPLTPAGGAPAVADATMVLNGAFLVDRAALDAFRAAVGARVREYQPRGLTFDFTGPWPPYNFVSADSGGALRGAGK